MSKDSPSHFTPLRRATLQAALSLFACLMLMLSIVSPVFAQSATSAVSGRVVAQHGAFPLSGATITVSQAGHIVKTVTTSADGSFLVSDLPPGLYDITVRDAGFESAAASQVALTSGLKTVADFTLLASVTESSDPSVIGHVTARSSLSAATTISQNVSPDGLTRTGQIRLADQLGTIPGVNFSTSSSVGDDSSVNLRGFSPDETSILLDGHPVGPLGVGSGGFNTSLGPVFGLSSINITFGSGAQGLYGNDGIGGAINFVTLTPTDTPHATFQQQFGGFGLLSSGITATGHVHKLGYAFALGTFGEEGDFAPSQIAQSARPNNVQSSSVSPNGACNGSATNDVSACNLALNTYTVSQNTSQKVLLGKFDYALGDNTKIAFTAYDGVQFSDSTGNGDNDYLPYGVRLGQIQKSSPTCTTSGGVAGYTVTTDPIAGTTACYTAQQFAAATYGPDGGGAGRDRGTRMADYHGSISTKLGNGTLTVDGYANNYVFYKNSSQSGGIDATGNLLGTPTYADYYNTTGFMINDEIVTGNNDLIFGYNVWHQLQTGSEIDASGITINPPEYFGEWGLFAHEGYTFNKYLSTFVNANIKRSSVSQKTTFDPRATLQVRPTNRDVFQVTYGRSDGAPSPSLLQTALPLPAADPGASLTSVNCGGFNDVASGGNSSLLPESANDYEAGYGHRFYADSNLQVNAYVTHVTNQIFGASEPLAQYGVGNVAFAPGALQTYINRINTQCGVNVTPTTVLSYLSVSTNYNAASALARGLEWSGRARINKISYIDFSYATESVANVGIDDNILQNNPTIINGAQLYGIPLHQMSVSLGLTPGHWDFRLDNYYVEQNNSLNRGSYWHSNAFLTRTFNHGKSTLTLGGTNIFNQAVSVYGLLGLGTTPAVNQFATSPHKPEEEFGLAPAQLTLTFQERY